MTTCRTCAEFDVTTVAAAAPAPPKSASQAQREAAILIRAWQEGDGVRARLLRANPPHRTVATAHGIEAICDAIQAWLRDLS